MVRKHKKTRPDKIYFDDKMHIIWQDELHTAYDYWDLRTSCPCAECVDEVTGQKILDDDKVDKDIRPIKSAYVGNYAIRIFWSDSHDIGMFTFSALREHYPHVVITSP